MGRQNVSMKKEMGRMRKILAVDRTTLPITIIDDEGRNDVDTLDIGQPLQRQCGLLPSENSAQQHNISKRHVSLKFVLISVLIFVAGICSEYNFSLIKKYLKNDGSFTVGDIHAVSMDKTSSFITPVNQPSNVSKSTDMIQHSNISKSTLSSTEKNIISSKKQSQNKSSSLNLANPTGNNASKSQDTIAKPTKNNTSFVPQAENLVLNPDFKDGTTSGWSKLGNVKLNIVSDPSPKHGSHAVSITGRTEAWNGISQEMSSRLIPGENYKVSAYVQLDSAPHDVKINFRESTDGSMNFKNGASGAVGTANEWVQIQGSYTASFSAKSILMYFEAPSGVNLLIDSISVTKSPGCDFNHFIQRFKPQELDITCSNFAELELGSFQGKGAQRKVTQATWHGRKVAVKEFYNPPENAMASIIREVSLLFQLRKAENIVKLVGFCNSTMVFEYAPTTLKTLVLDEKEVLSVGQALALGLDVVKGLSQLHAVPNGPVVHADIHLKQYLLNSAGKVLLGDFDQSEYVGLDNISGEKKCSYTRDYPRKQYWAEMSHSPPEMLSREHELDEKADVYQVSLVLWALCSRESPYKYMEQDGKDLIAGGRERIIAGERPDLALVSAYPQEMKDLIVEAWDSDPSKRPSAADLVKRMENIVQKYGQLAVDSV